MAADSVLRRFLLAAPLALFAASPALAASIEGRVTGAGTPLAGVWVEIDDSQGNWVSSTPTDAAGNYAVSGLADGTYYVSTFGAGSYINEAWNNQVCLGCDITTTTPIVVFGGGAVTGIDFDLALGTTISGTVRDTAAAPLENVVVYVVNAGNTFLASGFTDSTGAYTTEALPAGTYYLRTDNSSGYVNEIHPDVPCLATCAPTSATPLVITVPTALTGLDFELALGGRITGTITDAATSLPIADVWVSIYDGAGLFLTQGRTDASGVYVSSDGLPSGTYYAETFSTGGYLPEFWNDRPCVGFCSPTSVGTPIVVAAPAVVSGVDFALVRGGRIAGTVRAAGTLAPLPAVSISVLTANGSFVSSGFTDSAGAYVTADGLPAGTYFVTTSNFVGLRNELYDDLPCAGFCQAAGGTPVVVATGATTSGVDFLLEAGGRVMGSVTDEATAAPLAGSSVNIVSATGATFASATVNSAGQFVTREGLPAGSFFARTSNRLGFVNELFDDVDCVGSLCPLTGGTPIAVTPPATTPGVGIALAAGGRIAGHVGDTLGMAIPGVSIQVYDPAGRFVASGRTDSVGNYITDAGLPSGVYFVKTSNSFGFLGEVYPNLPCAFFSCAPTSGGGVSVTLPSTTGGIDFQLERGGSVAGTVTATAGAVPLGEISVSIYDGSGSFVTSARTDALGQYRAVGLPGGTYHARTTNSLGYINELYDNVPCPSFCQVNTGTPFTVVLGALTTGVDFALDQGGRISGRVTSGGSPLNDVFVRILNAAGSQVAGATTDISGNYVTPNGLPAGVYYARTSNTQGYINEEYDNVRCVGSCTLGLGTPISVGLGSTTTGIDFALTLGGRVAGTITDASSGVGIGDVNVSILDASGRNVAFGFSDAAGGYITDNGLPTGSYYARTLNFGGYVEEAWPDTPCLGTCPAVTGSSFSVTEGLVTFGIDFGLAAGGRIAGRITDATTGEPLDNVSVQLHDASGRFVTSGFPNESGFWTTDQGLPPGTYFARTFNGSGYINELYGGAPCAGACVVTSGTPILVTGTGTTSGIDFALERGGRIAGTVTASGGGALPGVTVQVLDAARAFVTTASTDFAGRYLTRDGLPGGSYFLRTSNGLGFVDQLYSGLPCVGACDVLAGSPVAVGGAGTVPGIDFALAPGGRVTGVVTHAGTGLALANVTVTLHDAAGTRVASGTTDGLGAYLTRSGVPAGTYYARTENTFGFVDEVFDDQPCLATCAPATGTPITLTAGTITTGVGFALLPDTDLDADGIAAAVDRDLVTGADESATPSDDFRDVHLGGSTSGTIAARSGWNVVVRDRSPGGVDAQVAGAGAGAARLDVCATGGAEAVLFDVAGERASVGCAGSTTSVTATVATPIITLREPPTGAGVEVLLTTGQTASLGSPVVASPGNTEPIGVRFVDDLGVAFGSLVLDPGESIDAEVASAGNVTVEVAAGVVTFDVNGETVTLAAGESHTFATADTTPPTVSCVATPSRLWPPFFHLVPVVVTVAVTDSGSGAEGFVLDSVTSSDPTIPWLPDVVGWRTGTPDTSGWLRAGMYNLRRGRVYTLRYTGRDRAGNTATCATQVTVPALLRR
jgi:hypothetical protein